MIRNKRTIVAKQCKVPIRPTIKVEDIKQHADLSEKCLKYLTLRHG